MKCPRCRKKADGDPSHCPYCGLELPKKRQRRVRPLTVILIVLGIVLLALAAVLGWLLFSGRLAIYYLRHGEYDKAVSVLSKFSSPKDDVDVVDALIDAGQAVSADYTAGNLDYNSAVSTINSLRSVSGERTEEVLNGILMDLSHKQAGVQAEKEVAILLDAEDCDEALRRIRKYKSSGEWEYFNEQTRAYMEEKRRFCEKTSLESKIAANHFFDDGLGNGAIHLAHDCREWDSSLFPDTCQRALTYLRSLDTDEQWRELLKICHSASAEIAGYREEKDFPYSDFQAIIFGTKANRSYEQCNLLLKQINEARTANGLRTLKTDGRLNTVASVLSGKLLVTDEGVEDAKQRDDCKVKERDCYEYLMNTNLLANDVFVLMQQDALTKQQFKTPAENLLTADWISKIGLHLEIRQNGALYWFLIATGTEPETPQVTEPESPQANEGGESA